eukprot:gene8544-10505_t
MEVVQEVDHTNQCSTAFNHTFLPEVNLANECPNTFDQYPLLMDCPEMADSIKKCQAAGKIVTLSLGGASGAYELSSPEQAATFAETIWSMFLGGVNNNYPRPFGDAILDGVDLDLEGGSPENYDELVKSLKQNYFQDASKDYYISMAPQCVFPDAYCGPGQNTALSTGLIDFINVQFYNNYCELSGSQVNFNDWSNWVQQNSPNTRIMVGVPADIYAASSGYLPASNVVSKLPTYASSPSFGGVMLWDVSIAEYNINNGINFAQYISQFLKKNYPSEKTN